MNYLFVFEAAEHSRYVPRLSEMTPDTWLFLLLAVLGGLYIWCYTCGTLVIVGNVSHMCVSCDWRVCVCVMWLLYLHLCFVINMCLCRVTALCARMCRVTDMCASVYSLTSCCLLCHIESRALIGLSPPYILELQNRSSRTNVNFCLPLS